MSLTNLLAVGQSVIGIRSDPTRYKMKQENLLPKFAPVGRPVSLAPISHPEAVPQAVVAPKVEAPPMEDLFAAPTPVTQTMVEIAPIAPVTTKPVAVRAPKTEAKRLESLAETRREQARSWFKNPFAGVIGRAKSERTLVQTELLLEQVKVVRNDLSEADIEVVPTAAKAAPAVTAAAEPVAAVEKSGQPVKPATEGTGWSRLTAKLFNANHASF